MEDYGEAISANAVKSYWGPRYMTPVWRQVGASCTAFSVAGVMGAKLGVQNEMANLGVEVATEISKQEFIDGIDKPLPHGFISTYGYAAEYAVHEEDNYPFHGAKMPRMSGVVNPELPKWGIGGRVKCATARLALDDLLQHGPLTARISVSNGFKNAAPTTDVFFHARNDRHEELGHAVLVIGFGFGFDGLVPYFIIKNSWGVHWGLNGYLKVHKNLLTKFCYPDLVEPRQP